MSILDNLKSQPNIDNQPSVSFHASTGFIFWVKMVKLFGGNNQQFILKRRKDLSEKSIPFFLEWYGKMSLQDI